ncbi:MAG: phosphoribosylglycinamide formyltransferase [Acidocella sp. 20-57-95]|nr:MAG: phosphoribosylglycinamide formyltransferase [Acidocella sp. 20-57-95]OYV58473.1 MAG: phosphoribosylglycinamide formyltransferase [Acidocella sp. 21-58-7]HQT64355.1 phosphoribosylglycinamide formyltransferase [Acidocella sp.]
MKVPVGILISGRGSNMLSLIEAAKAPDYPAEIVLVLSNRETAPGLHLAAQHGIPTIAVASKAFGADREAHERAVQGELVRAGVQVVCLAGYMRLLTPYFVGQWAGRMLNIHPSLLPKYPGLETHQRVLEAGDKIHGCTVHVVTDGMDEGPIVGQAEVAVLPGDTEESLAKRVLAAEHLLFPRALKDFLKRDKNTT